MNKKVKKIFQSNEPYIFLIIILLGIDGTDPFRTVFYSK